jgi:hypothetical protein
VLLRAARIKRGSPNHNRSAVRKRLHPLVSHHPDYPAISDGYARRCAPVLCGPASYRTTVRKPRSAGFRTLLIVSFRIQPSKWNRFWIVEKIWGHTGATGSDLCKILIQRYLKNDGRSNCSSAALSSPLLCWVPSRSSRSTALLRSKCLNPKDWEQGGTFRN